MPNAFDKAWNTAFATEKSVFGGEYATSGAERFEVAVLEFDRRKVVGTIGGATNQIAGQVVMAREDWVRLANGKNSAAATLRGILVRFEPVPESPDVDGVVLNIVAAVSN